MFLGVGVIPASSADSAATTAVIAAPAMVAAASRNGRVRPFERADLEPVARLFLGRFRRRGRTLDARAVADVAEYMDRLYLQGPYAGDGLDALVQTDRQGEIGGFLGLLKTRYVLDGEVLKACIISTLMSAEGAGHEPAGPQLLRAVNGAGFDMQLTDSANRTSLAFARPLKYQLLAFDSLDWVRAFKPATMLVDRMHRAWPHRPLQLMMPLAGATDALIGRALKAPPDRHRTAHVVAETIDATAFVELAPRFLAAFRLRPVWPAQEVAWLVAHAAEKQANGPLHFALLRDAAGAPVGCYAFHGAPGRVALVLHLFAADARLGLVLDHLMNAAAALGCSGVAGQARNGLMPHLYRYPGLMLRYGGGTMVRAARKDVMAAVRAEDVFIGGLVGDRWTRLSADSFGGTRRSADDGVFVERRQRDP